MSAREHSTRGSTSSRSHHSSAGGGGGHHDVASLLPPPLPLHSSSASDIAPTESLPFEPCAATGSFFLYAQRNMIVALHHDTLAVERRFDKHQEDVSIIAVDTLSDRGQGRHVCSYDVGQVAIVWDLFTGDEIARFESYEQIRVASFTRAGNIAFGNVRGNVILFEIATSEHVSSQTIFDPITALAPAADCRTYAVGYQNGSIFIATLQPTFAVVHTLNTGRGPSPVSGLAWHGSASKQKTDMLATQTMDGDLRVWSVAKAPLHDPPRVIRVLSGGQLSPLSRSWFAWSKNGRIVQYSDGETRAWDVRTKTVTSVPIATVANVISIANFGPTATLFTLSSNHGVQQYDINPSTAPSMVANVQHAPENAPPTPPDSTQHRDHDDQPQHQHEYQHHRHAASSRSNAILPQVEVESTDEDESVLSPLDKIAREMDQLEEERRDMVGPLSPVSSKASQSSASSYGGRRRAKQRNRSVSSSKASEISSADTYISLAAPSLSQQQRGGASLLAPPPPPAIKTQAKQEAPRRVEAAGPRTVDMFPYTRVRVSEVKFRSPQYGGDKSPDNLRREMLSVLFGWDHDIEALILDERARHPSGSVPAILLSKWLGDSGVDALTQMIGSESMTSSDWMLLALSTQMGQGPQKQMGEAFVKRLLETDEVHPAVAILIGLGDPDEAVEAYVTRNFLLEALLLTCLIFPNDWQRQCHLVRRWGEAAIAEGQAELAVRCFACTSVESSEPWFSPRAQDAVYAAQQKKFASISPPLSPPGEAGAHNRLTAKNASLKLITSFGDRDGQTSASNANADAGFTPIAESALSPGGSNAAWKRSTSRNFRDPSSARTATPGGYSRRQRQPSAEPSIREDDGATPLVSQLSRPSSRMSNRDPGSALHQKNDPFRMRKEASRTREGSRDRNRNRLHLDMVNVAEVDDVSSTMPSTASTTSTMSASRRPRRSGASVGRDHRALDDASPLPPSDDGHKSFKGRSIDLYINSLDEANQHAQQLRQESKSRAEERSRSMARRRRDGSSSRSDVVAYIQPSKRSPSSPVPMSSEDASRHRRAAGSVTEDDRDSRVRASSRSAASRQHRAQSKPRRRDESPERLGVRSGSRAARPSSKGRSRASSPDASGLRDDRGRSSSRRVGSYNRSPSSPSPMGVDASTRSPLPQRERTPAPAATSRAHSRTRSSTRAQESTRSARARSSSRRPRQPENDPMSPVERSSDEIDEAFTRVPETTAGAARPRAYSSKALAAKELEERRLSLARRPSAPAIPHPAEYSGRPSMSPRAMTDQSPMLSAFSYTGEPGIQRSQTADPEVMGRLKVVTGAASKAPSIGLPATPRSLRVPKAGSQEDASPVPEIPAIPESFQTLTPSTYGGMEQDGLGPLLPSTVYGGGGGGGGAAARGTARSASAPPEKSRAAPAATATRPRRDSKGSTGHGRRTPMAGNKDSIQETAEGEVQVIDVPETSQAPPVIAELQHLMGPPPPPPPPPAMQGAKNSLAPSGVINIAIDSANGDSQSAAPGVPLSERATPSASPGVHRKTPVAGNSSASPADSTTSISSKWKSVRDRMRSDSRSRRAELAASRTKSPPTHADSVSPAAYEKFLPPVPSLAGAHAFSPQGEHQQTPWAAVPDRPTPVQSPETLPKERNPRQVRANMPPTQLQPGVYVPPADRQYRGGEGGMI